MKKERWVVSAKRADFQAIADRFGIDPVIARLIRNRDVTGEKEIEEYLFGDLEQLHDPFGRHIFVFSNVLHHIPQGTCDADRSVSSAYDTNHQRCCKVADGRNSHHEQNKDGDKGGEGTVNASGQGVRDAAVNQGLDRLSL